MFILVAFAFLAGIVTILSPCILPILPVVLSSSVGNGHRRPFGIIIGFIVSFTFFTLALSGIVRATHLSPDVLRWVAVVILAIFGLSMVIPKTQELLERLFSSISGFLPKTSNSTGFFGGLLVGVSLGLVWSPCVGPILASIITLAATSAVTAGSVIITLAYSIGTAIPMFAIMIGGRNLLNKIPALSSNTKRIQQIFGVLMIVTAFAIATGVDRKFQLYILTAFPQYGVGLVQFEDRGIVRNKLEELRHSTTSTENATVPNFLTPDYGPAPDFSGGTNWLNSKPLTIAELKGKVVLVDFWTYTCINCIRTLPYVTGWYEKYKDKGFVVVGVHAPEFEFEKKTENVVGAMKDYKINYPVVQDNDFKIWTAYNNQYWPAEYFVDRNGHIRKKHFGEGKYEETEKFIQQLLGEKEGDTLEIPEVQIQTRTPETYLGYERLGAFASPEKVIKDEVTTYSFPKSLDTNEFAYGGNWMVGAKYAAPGLPSDKAALEFSFSSKEVYLVMRPKDPSKPSRIRVLIDGKEVDAARAGDDVKNGVVTVDKERLYRLIKFEKMEQHTLLLDFLDDGVEVFAFTFG